jgi:ribonuclease Y
MDIIIFVAILGAVVIGGVVGYSYRNYKGKTDLTSAEGKAQQALEEAKREAAMMVTEAKEKSLEILEDAKRKEDDWKNQISRMEARLEKREHEVDETREKVEKAKEQITKREQEIQKIREDLEQTRAKEMQRLETIAGLNQEQAKNILMQLTEEEHKDVLAERMAKLEQKDHEELEKKAAHLMAQVIQGYARSHAADVMTSTVHLPSEELKGKIIGKEGRNIRSFERETGVEVVIDESPDTIIISSFDSVRREIARIALEELMKDGRINPARIEEAVEDAKKAIDGKIKEAGEAAVFEAGVPGLHPKLIYILGRLRYRTSYKQNQLLHSLEVSYLAGALAAELGLDEQVARTAGLLHDIGKAVDHEVQGTHVNIGIKILQKFNVSEDVIIGMRSHHDEYPYASPIAYLVTAADAISASRPGARRETVEKYLERMRQVEEIGTRDPRVQKCYSVNAGRELRVFVIPEQVDDYEAQKLAASLAQSVQEEVQFPGEIKVNVIRETRAVEYAR